MDWGMENRMKRIFQPDGRCFMMPIDHGYFLGPTRCLEKPGETIAPLLPYMDALFLTRGVLRNCIDPGIKVPIILRVSGCTSIAKDELSHEAITTSIEEVLRVNASGVGVQCFIQSEHEYDTLKNLCDLVNSCENYGIPVMAVTAVGKELERREARYLGMCCRILAELGARVVKTYWCENFEKVVNGCPVPVVVAGGPKCETALEVMEFVHDGLEKGAAGINLGRNVWQHEHPVPMMRALRSIVHEKETPKEAVEIFEELKAAG